MFLLNLFSPPGIPFPFIFKAACQNHPTLQSPDQVPPPKITESESQQSPWRSSKHPPQFTDSAPPTPTPPKTMKSENLSDSARISYRTMIQIQSSMLMPNFSTSEPSFWPAKSWRTKPFCLCFSATLTYLLCIVFTRLYEDSWGKSHIVGVIPATYHLWTFVWLI